MYEELDLGDSFIDTYMTIVINNSREELCSDPDAINDLEFDDYVLPIFIPKAQ